MAFPFPLTILQAALISAVIGVSSHLLYFIRGEHHLHAVRLFHIFLSAPLALFGLFTYLTNLNYILSAQLAAAVYCNYLSALWASMIIYRVFFHRLRKYPGPFGAKVTKLWHVAQLGGFDNYKQLDKLHKKYGPVVRTGPNELSVISPDAIPKALGPGTNCFKAPWYDIGAPMTSLHGCRDKPAHDARRKVWDRGFNAKSLRDYESRVLRYTGELTRQIGAFGGKPLNMSLWMDYFAFDVMGDLAFGKAFGMLSSGKAHFALDLLHEGQRAYGILTPVPWAFFILASIPALSKNFKRFVAWCDEQVEQRKEMILDEPDLMSHLLDASEKAQDKANDRIWLMGDSRLIIVAGSDTTAATLTYLFFRLAQNRSYQQRLRDELIPLAAQSPTFQHKDIQNAEFLNAIINETLRMHPPTPAGVLRITPPEGVDIAGEHIPGDVVIGVPMYPLGRSETIFARPLEFIPERWSSQPELVKYKTAYAPFSIGAFSCIGKQLALMEIRCVVYDLVTRFDIRLADGETGEGLLNGTKDIFTVELGELRLVFEPRS